ncbi:hypothetical protein H5410_050463 [Solanum commersonii]|uniref:Uncharacterized protein n=1 Tax=Solanum commersonii TaxID=4109 RepID=A0A9J5WXN5_SOLCO|nr:hypothetical protein H5410_050463 [Solanum commersonii]
MTKTRGGIIKQSIPKTSKNKKKRLKNSTQANDDVESSDEKTGSGDEKSSRDTRDTRDEDDDLLSLPICARQMYGKSYNLTK